MPLDKSTRDVYSWCMEKFRVASKSAFKISLHAAERYVERCAGNVTIPVATQRLQRILSDARRKRPAPGGAYVYATHGLEAVVKNGVVLTVYFPSPRPAAYAIEA